MKSIFYFLAAAFFCCNSFGEGKTFQYSTINSLLNGDYNGSFSLKDLRSHGDFGIGTYRDLDGEMILLDGVFYQIKADGKVYQPELEIKTPFAVVTNFKEDITFKTEEAVTDLKVLGKLLDAKLPTENIIYAVKVDADFSYVKVRSVPAQVKPFKPLVAITKDQPVFEYKNIKGTLVCFRFPAFTEKINVPEYHFHFISEDKTVGGHLLEVKIRKAEVRISKSHNFELSLPKTAEFYRSNVSGNNKSDINQAEK